MHSSKAFRPFKTWTQLWNKKPINFRPRARCTAKGKFCLTFLLERCNNTHNSLLCISARFLNKALWNFSNFTRKSDFSTLPCVMLGKKKRTCEVATARMFGQQKRTKGSGLGQNEERRRKLNLGVNGWESSKGGSNGNGEWREKARKNRRKSWNGTPCPFDSGTFTISPPTGTFSLSSPLYERLRLSLKVSFFNHDCAKNTHLP